MGHKRIMVIWITVFLSGVIVIGGMLDTSDVVTKATQNVRGLSLTVDAGGRSETIRLWKDENGICYGFLPGYIQMEQVTFRVEPGCTVYIDHNPIADGMSAQSLSRNVPYTLKIGETEADSMTFLLVCAGQIPTLYVDVTSGNMEYIHMDKENEERGKMRLYGPEGSLQYRGMLKSVKGRGNATWTWEKKSYGLTLMTEADILGMGEAKNWVLLSNVYDDSHVRNKLVYDTAAKLGLSYSPQSQWVSLYLNGEYAGLYLLCEKNEIHPQRVDIDEENGNLISIEKQDRLWQYGSDQFLTDAGIPIRVRGREDLEKTRQKINTLERAILSENGIDPISGQGWQEMLDLESWAKKYLIEEGFGNLDAGSISQFFYWEDSTEDGKIYAGPVWDYDVTMGNPRVWQLRDSNMLYAQRPHLWNPQDTPWFSALYQKTEFRECVEQLYVREFRPLLKELLDGGMEAYGRQVSDAADANRLRWKTEDPRNALEQMEAYMQSRMAFLDRLWIARQDMVLVSLYMNWHVMACYAVEPGGCIPVQEVPGNWGTIEYLGWYDYATEEPFDFAKPILEDTIVYLKEVDTEERAVSGGLGGKLLYIPAAAMLVLLMGLAAVDVSKDRNNMGHTKPEKAGRR